MNSSTALAPAPNAKLPPQIPFIIGNEGCERFSFYGMRNILTQFLVSSAILGVLGDEAARKAASKDVFHTFVIGVYFFPLLGGWLADRFLGKYRTILYLSLVYCVGHGFLAAFENNRNGFFAGLFLIALGSGGIKPCVSSFVGDQFDQSNKHLAKFVFDAFYWIINFGSFFASLLMPVLLKRYNASVAFGVPGILMLLATLVFWLGRGRYIHEPPVGQNPHSFARVCWTALTGSGFGLGTGLAALGAIVALGTFFFIKPLGFVSCFCLAIVSLVGLFGLGTWMQIDGARSRHPEEAVEGVRSVLRLLVLFMLVTPFWSLFDQKASTWVLQADAMTKPEWFQPSQMQALNPALVMGLLPFNNLVLYPLLRKLGVEPRPLRRMTAGIAFAGLAWIVIGFMQLAIDGGTPISITWQILPYALLTFGEVLVSATGLEFAYSQAPPAMKGALMSFWSLSVTIGNLWVLLANSSVKSESFSAWAQASSGMSMTAFLMFFFAGFAFIAALAFGAYASRYKVVDHYRKA